MAAKRKATRTTKKATNGGDGEKPTPPPPVAKALLTAPGGPQRTVTLEISPKGIGASGWLYLGGTQFGDQLRVTASKDVKVPSVPVEYRGRTTGSGDYTLEAKVDDETIGTTSGTAPDPFSIEF